MLSIIEDANIFHRLTLMYFLLSILSWPDLLPIVFLTSITGEICLSEISPGQIVILMWAQMPAGGYIKHLIKPHILVGPGKKKITLLKAIYGAYIFQKF